MEQQDLPLYKKEWFIILMIIFVFPFGLTLMWLYTDWLKQTKWFVTGIFILIMAISPFFASDDEDTIAHSEEDTDQSEEQVDSQERLEETNAEMEAFMEEHDLNEEESEDSDLPEEIADLHLTDVRNDSTGEWQKAVTSNNVNMPDNALAYFDEYMENGDTHYIVSFATDTTIAVSDTGTQIYVTITEYKSNEEHDANELGSGILLDEYVIDKDSGNIEEI